MMFSGAKLQIGTRVACGVEYHGKSYSGWQLQTSQEGLTIQGLVEDAISFVADKKVRVHCAGRTDAGVHSLGQVFHFDDPVGRSLKAWVYGVNGQLPKNIRILWAQVVPNHFHSRFSATSRIYRYLVFNHIIHPAIMSGLAAWHRRPLNEMLMQKEAQCLIGEHDFSTFRAASCQSSTPMRNIISLNISRRGNLVLMDIEANAFLHHMVRNIAGCILAIGDGREKTGWLKSILHEKDRSKAAETACPSGLYLMSISYPNNFSIPKIYGNFPLCI